MPGRPGTRMPSTLGSAPAPPAPKVVDVSGAVAWTRTGLHLTQGERFDVRATGQVSFIQTAPPVWPDGATDPHPGVCVLPGPRPPPSTDRPHPRALRGHALPGRIDL